jgi:Flp pilus assembly protein TadD
VRVARHAWLSGRALLAAGLIALGTPAGAQSTAPASIDAGAAQSDPRQANTALNQANRLLKEGQHEAALKTLDVALQSAPRDPRLRFLYGYILSATGRSRDAVDVFEQLTQDFPELPEPYNNLAVLYAARGDLDAARRALENAVRVLPAYALAHENLGDVYLRMAARAYEQAGRADPTNASSRRRLEAARELLTRFSPPLAPPAASGQDATAPASSPAIPVNKN